MKCFSLTLIALFASVQTPTIAQERRPGRFEADAGWVQLFDGKSTAGWRAVGEESFPSSGWDVVDGSLHHSAAAGGGDIMTSKPYGDFELEFEWKVASGANSGVKYLVQAGASGTAAFGPEYQVLDNEKHANGKSPKTSAGALYGVAPVSTKRSLSVGSFNHGRIVSRNGRIEHWLNGECVVNIDTAGDTWKGLVANSKFAKRSDFAKSGPGHIALQDHGDEVWFRNLRLRELPGPSSSEVGLYNGRDLSNWREFGDALYSANGDSILGAIGGGAQSFLISKESYGDFVLEVDVMTELPGNSGIQIRSHEKEGGRPYGYQIEIDSSERSWSGGLFDEARRGWLQNLEANRAGRKAFAYQSWNRFRIETNGPWIKAWINGVPTTDFFDTYNLEGFFALQVHSGNDTRVQWRNLRLWDHGERAWERAGLPESWTGAAEDQLLVSEELAPVIKFAMQAAGGELSLRLQNERATHQCQENDPAILELDDGWCVKPAAAAKFKSAEWNSIGLGFDGLRCALEVNGVTQIATRKQALKAKPLFRLIASGDGAEIHVRDLKSLSEQRPRKR